MAGGDESASANRPVPDAEPGSHTERRVVTSDRQVFDSLYAMLDRWFRRLNDKLDYLLNLEVTMAVDQATFDAALSQFVQDIDDGVNAILAKVAGVNVDFTPELAQLDAAKSTFDAAVGTITAPPAEPTPPATEPEGLPPSDTTPGTDAPAPAPADGEGIATGDIGEPTADVQTATETADAAAPDAPAA
jgi:hypothetical protein